MDDFMVEASPGYKGEDTPRAFTLEGVRYEVSDIVERWEREEYLYFRVRTGDGVCYVLRFALEEGAWELVMKEGL